MIKEGYIGEHTFTVSVHNNHYNKSLSYVDELFTELKKDFPNIEMKDVSVGVYNDSYRNGFLYLQLGRLTKDYLTEDIKSKYMLYRRTLYDTLLLNQP